MNLFSPLFLTEKIVFPDYKYAFDDIIGIGGDYNPYRLLLAYSMGIFPWPYSEDDPIYWAFPALRCLLYPENFVVRKSLRQSIRNKKFEVRVDTAFEQVIRNCATVERPNQQGTWIFDDLQQAYIYLHQLGLAHSVEIWQENKLVGGLYGVSLGHAFFGESMFALVSDASKAALFFLVQQAMQWKFKFIDAQVYTKHLSRLGAIEVDAHFFLDELHRALQYPTLQGKWTNLIDKSLFKI